MAGNTALQTPGEKGPLRLVTTESDPKDQEQSKSGPPPPTVSELDSRKRTARAVEDLRPSQVKNEDEEIKDAFNMFAKPFSLRQKRQASTSSSSERLSPTAQPSSVEDIRLLPSSPMEWKHDGPSSSVDSAEVKKLGELVSQLKLLLEERKIISTERGNLENMQKRLLKEGEQTNAEKRALELRLRNLRLDTDQRDNNLCELEFSLDNIVYQDERRSSMEMRLREDINTMQEIIEGRANKELQSMHELLSGVKVKLTPLE
ncbi:MAG: hypothetical protein Q9226_002248 [Calogaya cf. arnoldii]